MTTKTQKTEEQIRRGLRALYAAYGYLPYKVSKFEEYDLYVQNKKFLPGDQILTFSDVDGKLMALKPDVTLSIVKNTAADERTSKVFYTESVYRVPRNACGFQEIMQTGLECIGRVDTYAMGEVLMLAARSLMMIDEDYVLDVSDIGVLSGILAQEPLDDEARARILSAVGEKNSHGLADVCSGLSVRPETERLLKALLSVYGPLEEKLRDVEALGLPEACRGALEELRAVAGLMRVYGIGNVNLDFSVVNDMDYYNGLIFKGFVDGIPTGVLSGGRYDNLMARMGRSGEAIGFAVYLDQLERYLEPKPAYDVDTLVLYDEGTDPEALTKTVESLIAGVPSLRVQCGKDACVTCRRLVRLNCEGKIQ